MANSVTGIYCGGRIELTEQPDSVAEETPVLVTFMTADCIDLKSRGITQRQAAELRRRLAAFSEEWDSRVMEAYDNYDTARSRP